MIEKKFRAWCETGFTKIFSTKVLYDGKFTIYDNKHSGIFTFIESAYETIIIEQFAGLPDCDGKEACEGDIVELDDIWDSKTGIVVFKNGSFCIELQNKNKTCVELSKFYDKDGYGNISCEYKIIGNIHEG